MNRAEKVGESSVHRRVTSDCVVWRPDVKGTGRATRKKWMETYINSKTHRIRS